MIETKENGGICPFERGKARWRGVVRVERPDLSRHPHTPFEEIMCQVMSARTLELNGRRAICQQLPYSLFAHYFTAMDLAVVFVYAEFDAGHLELYERAAMKDWFEQSGLTH